MTRPLEKELYEINAQKDTSKAKTWFNKNPPAEYSKKVIKDSQKDTKAQGKIIQGRAKKEGMKTKDKYANNPEIKRVGNKIYAKFKLMPFYGNHQKAFIYKLPGNPKKLEKKIKGFLRNSDESITAKVEEEGQNTWSIELSLN